MLLLFRAVRDDRRPCHAEPDHADVRGRVGPRHLLVEDRLEAVGRAGAPVLFRPGQPGVTRLMQHPAPLAAEVVAVPLRAAAAAALFLRQVRVEPRPQLGPECGLVRRVAQVHAARLARCGR